MKWIREIRLVDDRQCAEQVTRTCVTNNSATCKWVAWMNLKHENIFPITRQLRMIESNKGHSARGLVVWWRVSSVFVIVEAWRPLSLVEAAERPCKHSKGKEENVELNKNLIYDRLLSFLWKERERYITTLIVYLKRTLINIFWHTWRIV